VDARADHDPALGHRAERLGDEFPGRREDDRGVERRRGILSVVDGAQAVGMIDTNIGAIGCTSETSPMSNTRCVRSLKLLSEMNICTRLTDFHASRSIYGMNILSYST
jgi:hypothetical protein